MTKVEVIYLSAVVLALGLIVLHNRTRTHVSTA